ncbi:MAG TPA: ribosome small subunit-dependent GTPase A [Thermoanaerobaculaceae bacterium]|nr:ribosome small subunit-dependent GTPase A [Thermoanaerobaculaceae bacterium]
MELSSLGWSDYFQQQLTNQDDAFVPGRVAFRHGRQVTVLGGGGEHAALLPARLAGHGPEAVAVGDWVLLDPAEDPPLARHLLARRAALQRKAAGRTSESQILAANVDLVLIVTGLDGDFSPRRIERLATLAWDGGATPVVVLNKADLCLDLGAGVREAMAAAPGAEVLVTAALEGQGVESVRALLPAGRTGVFAGSSGVGKSTLINRLLGSERQRTGAVRADDGRGRHVTTARQLLPLPGGGVLIDVPGLREVGLWGGDEGLDHAFADIATLAAGCRYSDCRHAGEPGCAVRDAIEAGRLAAARLESFQNLQRELAWAQTRHDAVARAEHERFWRQIHRAQRQHQRLRAREGR